MNQLNRRAWVEQIMGLPVSVHLRGNGSAEPREVAVARVFAELRTIDEIFSPYRPDSDISALRRGEVSVEDCDPLVARVLDLGAEAFRRTDGYFALWRPGPDGDEELDPSGLVKGWAIQRAARHLAALGDDDYYLNAGGDIVLGLAVSDDAPAVRQPWRIGVEDPFRPGALIGVVPLAGGGLATSGLAHRGHHIVDPHTGQPATEVMSATVIGPSLLWADVFATACCAVGPDAIERLDWPAGYHAIIVTPTGEVRFSRGMRSFLDRLPQEVLHFGHQLPSQPCG
jgi:FAD:protein FMN transferase